MNAAQRKLWDAAAPLIRANVLATLSIGQKWEVVNRTRAIAVARVLNNPWSEMRLNECRRRLAAGETAPPIVVHRFWLFGEPFYTLSDGNHRTEAVREAGRQRIRAEITEESWCEVDRIYIDIARRRLFRSEPGNNYLKAIASDLKPEEIPIYLKFGAERIG